MFGGGQLSARLHNWLLAGAGAWAVRAIVNAVQDPSRGAEAWAWVPALFLVKPPVASQQEQVALSVIGIFLLIATYFTINDAYVIPYYPLRWFFFRSGFNLYAIRSDFCLFVRL